jgi:thioredoxin reductase (NADPH)
MGPPVLLAVDGDPVSLGDIEQELEDRYARHYRVLCRRSPGEACEDLVALRDAGEDVALVLAAQDLDGMTGSALLEDVRDLHPRAKRALLVAWGTWGEKGTGEVILDGIGHGRFDHYVLRPARSPDELFHQTISSLLLEWAEASQDAPYTVHVVGESWSGRAYEIRSALQTCAVSHSFCLADSDEGRSFLAAAGDGAQLPLMVLPNGTILENPTNAQIAVAAGGPVDPGRLEFDVVIVGAGPAGLSAAVYGASEGFGTLVVDRGGIGGQATSSSLIRNYLGFPRGISGRQLAQGAYSQAWVFGAEFTFMHDVADLRHEDDHLAVVLSDGTRIRTSAVLLATGASYRRLDVPTLEALVGAGVYYGGSTSEAPTLSGRDVFIVGGANSAGQAALHLARYARRVTLVVRAASLAAGMSDYLVRQVDATGNIDVRTGTQVVDGGGDGRLEHLALQGPDGATSVVPADALFLMIGARPNTDWLPDAVRRDPHGFVLTGRDVEEDGTWPLERPPLLLETSMPRVFAAGDVRHGGVRRVASAVGEGSIAIQLLHQLYASEQRRPLGRPVVPTADGG